MRYLTKEWYMMMQKSVMGSSFEADERAAQINEALFEEALQRREKEISEWIEDFCSMAETSEELDTFPNHLLKLCEIMGDEKYQSTSAAYEYYHQHPEVLHDVMLLRLHDWMEYNRTFYPPEILDMVADERVFACGVATADVIAHMNRIKEENKRRAEAAMAEERKSRTLLKGKISAEILKYFSFHDVKVNGLRCKENDLIIELDRYANDHAIEEIRLHDCRIDSMDEDIEGAYWLYEELDMTEDGRIRAGVLLYKLPEYPCESNTADVYLREMNLTAKDITFVQNEAVKEYEACEEKNLEEIELEYGSADDMSYEEWCAVGCAIDEACRNGEI